MDSNALAAAQRRRQLDEVMDEVRHVFSGRSNHAILRDVVGTPAWRAAMRELGYGEHVITLPRKLNRGEGDRNAPFRAAMRERWFFTQDGWPCIGGEQVEILEALLMPTELADYPKATWNPKEEHYGVHHGGVVSPRAVGEAVLPYASYD